MSIPLRMQRPNRFGQTTKLFQAARNVVDNLKRHVDVRALKALRMRVAMYINTPHWNTFDSDWNVSEDQVVDAGSAADFLKRLSIEFGGKLVVVPQDETAFPLKSFHDCRHLVTVVGVPAHHYITETP